MAKRQGSPMKLEWTDLCRRWTRHHDNLPPGVSKVSAQLIVYTLARAAKSDGTSCWASARWIEREVGINAQDVVRPFLAFLEENGWLVSTGQRSQITIYRLVIPAESAEGVSAPDGTQSAEGVSAPNAEGVSALAQPKVQRKVQRVSPILPTPEGVERDGASAPPSHRNGNGSGSLSPADLQQWRGSWEFVAKHRGLDIYALDTGNRDLQAEFARLSAWDAKTLHAALQRPRSVKTETGWFLAQLRRLPIDPDEHEGVGRASALRLAHLHQPGDERDRLVALAKRHGYIDSEGAWTALGLPLRQKVGDHHDEGDPLWALVEGAA